MSTEQLDRLAAACGVQRRSMSDEQLFEACLRAIRTMTGAGE